MEDYLEENNITPIRNTAYTSKGLRNAYFYSKKRDLVHRIPEYSNSDREFQIFSEKYGESIAETVYKFVKSWKNSSENKETNVLWYKAQQDKEHYFYDLEEPEEKELEAVELFEEFNQELLRERFDGDILLYRGVSYEEFKRRAYTRKNFLTGEKTFYQHKPVESWSIDPEVAVKGNFLKDTSRKVLRKKFPIKDVLASHITFPKNLEHTYEKEFIVKQPVERGYRSDQVISSLDYDFIKNSEWACNELSGLKKIKEKVWETVKKFT